jgi:hypothetical protein
VSEIVLELLVGVGRDAQRPYLEELGVEEGLGVGPYVVDERFDEILRLTAPRADKNSVAGVDDAEYPLFSREFFGIECAHPFYFFVELPFCHGSSFLIMNYSR